ncbi:MAG: hypothetical protein H7842_02700 [Gammaproteobacteria bacterium SHHR-1]
MDWMQRVQKGHQPLMLNEALVKDLSEGVLRIDKEGQIIWFNSAAEPWVMHSKKQQKTLSLLIKASLQGRISLPVKMRLFEHCEDCRRPEPVVWLQQDSKEGYLLLINQYPEGGRLDLDEEQGAAGKKPRSGARRGKVSTLEIVDPFFKLIDKQALGLMDRLEGMLRRIEEDPEDEEAQEAPELAGHVAKMLGELRTLADLYQRDQVFNDERFGLAPLLAELLPQLPYRTGPGRIHYYYEEEEGIGQIYGQRSWLGRALLALLTHLARACRGGMSIRINLRQVGDYVFVSGGQFVDRNPSENAVRAPQKGKSEQITDLRIEICNRIIELHGGTLKLKMDAQGQMESFVTNLPTGVPAHDRSRVSCRDCRITHQAMEFAKDLATLMSEQEAGPRLPAANGGT